VTIRADGGASVDELPLDGFERFFSHVERRLTVALSARYGPEVGREAAVDSLSWAWENWERLRLMGNPVGYLYRVGQTSARRRRWTRGTGVAVPDRPRPSGDTDLDLENVMSALSARQRQVTFLVHVYGFTHREAADVLGISTSSVQNHAERGIAKLRQSMEGDA
jgi:DNA-directed RNA polymerase specialized sigma24 family protein